MSFLTQVYRKEKLKLQEEFKTLILQRADMLAWYARQLVQIFDDNEDTFEVSANVDTSLLVKSIEKLDADFAAKEETFWKEYQKLAQRNKKLLFADQKEALDLAIACFKNRLNISIVFVSDEAKAKLPQAKKLGVTGAAIARLEYLSDLTLAKQIKIFDDILKGG